MERLRVLFTGDYWHREFAGFIRDAGFPITLQPFGSLGNLFTGSTTNSTMNWDYQLVVVAQSRRSQFGTEDVERLMHHFANVPVVSLCGSWCEGELRSGTPIPGMIRIYWHQWQGRLEFFLRQLEQQKLPSWHLPRICSIADRILHDVSVQIVDPGTEMVIGISSLTADGFSMLRDAFSGSNHSVISVERFDATDALCLKPDVLLVEGNSLTAPLIDRIRDLQKTWRQVPQILVLNFPRRQEYESARRLGITEIVSKPFELSDLHTAIGRALLARAA